MQVPAGDLTLIANKECAETIANREQIERWLMVRVYGVDAHERYPQPEWRQDPNGIWTDKPSPPPVPRSRPEVDHCFLADDTGQDARVRTDEEAKGRTNVVECVVTRALGD